MPLTRQEATTLAALVHELRPAWDTAGIIATLKRCAHRPEQPGHIAQALIRAALDREAQTPAALLARPSYWNLEQPQSIPRARLTPEHECPLHPGQWAATCSPCHGVAKGEDHGGELPEDYDPARGRGLADYYAKQARAEAQVAPLRFREKHPERRTGELVHVITDVPARHSTNPANLTHDGSSAEPASTATPERTEA